MCPAFWRQTKSESSTVLIFFATSTEQYESFDEYTRRDGNGSFAFGNGSQVCTNGRESFLKREKLQKPSSQPKAHHSSLQDRAEQPRAQIAPLPLQGLDARLPNGQPANNPTNDKPKQVAHAPY